MDLTKRQRETVEEALENLLGACFYADFVQDLYEPYPIAEPRRKSGEDYLTYLDRTDAYWEARDEWQAEIDRSHNSAWALNKFATAFRQVVRENYATSDGKGRKRTR